MLTRRQKECFDFIVAYKAEHGVTPSYREIMEKMQLSSPGNVHSVVSALVSRGVIARHPKMARGIDILRYDV